MTWWREAVFYEIYVRSFQDSNDDGIGDLGGIESRLPYLAALGVDALWITPFYPSPQIDFGYDISDHEDVDPQFGSLADFERLIEAAHRQKMKIVIDLVLNHTSDRHPRFVASRASRTSPYRDWYVWRDGRGDGVPPNNWESAFGGPAWSYDETTGQWFYHYFYAEQPDLNWRNPAVEAWMFDTVRFWLGRGVDGFRLDAINTLFEDEALRDNPTLATPRVKLTGVVSQDTTYTRGLPEVHEVLRRLRVMVDREAPGTLLISEAYVDTIDDLVRFYGVEDAPQVQLPFNFFLAQVPVLSAPAVRQVVDDIERRCGSFWPSLVFNNHDIDRACDRYGEGRDREGIARLLAVLLLTLRGSPFIYYGDEIGMRTFPPHDIDDVRDPVGRTFWPQYKGRDGVRRPMAWDRSANAGFTRGVPWLALAPDAHTRNVEAQRGDAESVLTLHRTLLAARRSSAALRRGSHRTLASHEDVFAFARETETETVIVALNCADEERDAGVRLEDAMPRDWSVIVGTHSHVATVTLESLRLRPLEGLVLRHEVRDPRP